MEPGPIYMQRMTERMSVSVAELASKGQRSLQRLQATV